jgi:hypothetical protein
MARRDRFLGSCLCKVFIPQGRAYVILWIVLPSADIDGILPERPERLS